MLWVSEDPLKIIHSALSADSITLNRSLWGPTRAQELGEDFSDLSHLKEPEPTMNNNLHANKHLLIHTHKEKSCKFRERIVTLVDIFHTNLESLHHQPHSQSTSHSFVLVILQMRGLSALLYAYLNSKAIFQGFIVLSPGKISKSAGMLLAVRSGIF